MDILIVNLTRMGDIIQSSVLVKNLKNLYPNSNITYLLLKNFQDAAFLIPEIDKIIPIDFSGILKNIDFLELNVAYEKIFNTLSFFSKKEYDKIINLSFSKLSAYISYFIKAKKKNGLLFKKNNEFVAFDKWSRFFLSIVDKREYSPFNLVDIYTKIGIEDNQLKNTFINSKAEENNFNFAFVLGASTYDRRWPPYNFANLAKLILKKYLNSNIYLLGTKSEEYLGEEFFKYINPDKRIINFIGKTSLIELDEIINKKISTVITNDTGTMHLSWYRGKKVIELSLGPALFNTTGPYGDGHIVIQPNIECAPCSYLTKCKDLKCHYLIKPELVFECIKYLYGDIKILSKSADVKILKSYFDEKGYVDYKLLSGLETNDIILKKNLKSIWLTTLENCLKKSVKYPIKSNRYNELIAYIKSAIKLIDNIFIDAPDLEEKIDFILKLEEKIRNFIFSNFTEIIPFWKYFEYTKNLFSEDNLEENLIELKELYNLLSFQIINLEGGANENIY